MFLILYLLLFIPLCVCCWVLYRYLWPQLKSDLKPVKKHTLPKDNSEN